MDIQRVLLIAGLLYVLVFTGLLLTGNYHGYSLLAHLAYGAFFFPTYYWFVTRQPRSSSMSPPKRPPLLTAIPPSDRFCE